MGDFMLNINYAEETISPVTSFYDKHKKLLIVNPDILKGYTETICTDESCRYPKLTLRILNHILADIDRENKWEASPRNVAKRLDSNYDTVTKCLKYLRSINALQDDS